MQSDVISEMLGVATDIESLKNERQAGLASQASFIVDTGGRFSADCIGNATILKRDATFIRVDSGPSMVQARMLLQPQTKSYQEKHDEDAEEFGLLRIANGTAPKVVAGSPNQGRNQMAVAVNTVAKPAHKRQGVRWWAWLAFGLPSIVNRTTPRVSAWSLDQGLNQLAVAVNTDNRLGIHWWAWLAISWLAVSIGASFFCSFASIAAMGFHTQKREVHFAQAASAGKHFYNRGTRPLKQSDPPPLSFVTAPSVPLPPLPPHSLEVTTANEQRFPALFTQLMSPPVPQSPLPFHSTQTASVGKHTNEQSLPAPFLHLTSPSVPLFHSEQCPSSSSSIEMHRLSSDANVFLCPQLVVPASCECSFRLNLKPARMTPAVITDVDGNTVMHVSIHGSASSQAASLCNARRVLLTTEGSGILAQCKNSELVDGEFHLLREDGQLFGKLWQTATESCGPGGNERKIYKVRSITGAEWHFESTLPQLTLDVTDSNGRLLALLRPEANSPEMPSQHSFDVDSHASLVRVAPHVDVSIVLCGFLTISNLM